MLFEAIIATIYKKSDDDIDGKNAISKVWRIVLIETKNFFFYVCCQNKKIWNFYWNCHALKK